MHRAAGLPQRGAEHASTSGRAALICARTPARPLFPAAAPRRPRGPHPGVARIGPDIVTIDSGYESDGLRPHPNPPEDLQPVDHLAGSCSIEDLASQVHALKCLVHQSQDVVWAQKAKIDQLTETLQEEMLRSRGPAPAPEPEPEPPRPSPFDSQRVGYGDRRKSGLFDARFHSTNSGATPADLRVLPDKIILVRHAESEGNVDNIAYTYIPDSQVPLTARGHMQARAAGKKIKSLMECESGRSEPYRLFFYISPYKRSLQTYEGISSQFPSHDLMGMQEEVQLREQDFGNFQDQQGKQREKAERLRFGRFFYRFPNGESGADVYDRITIFEDHMIRDINAGRFADKTALVLVSHGLALRVFLMRWFHWTVDEFLQVYNPGNAEPLVLERAPSQGENSWRHTKSLYKLTPESMLALRGCTSDMCATDHLPRDKACRML
ncbi:Broad-range acid phosphatase DET1 [Tetrabaena socialis]|uniref:Broad-range acid phosphatase DET1 n=1 Tax=Tetrabaena socialis TaxID=47790 RepID=A0A2J8AIN2_9CHLO|nr:Broad-range acid phosphatase DET1 [Tetrabaena socialis]|eukprot:PNH12379.1 Broad-range acid phosphatase DET1 [Tetrabaena socialis]